MEHRTLTVSHEKQLTVLFLVPVRVMLHSFNPILAT